MLSRFYRSQIISYLIYLVFKFELMINKTIKIKRIIHIVQFKAHTINHQ